MPEHRYPTIEEFWKRLELRHVERDLQQALRDRTHRERAGVARLRPETTVVAVAARLLPGDVPPEALAAFLDGTYDDQLGRGDERAGLMARDELIPAGFAILDDVARDRHASSFAGLDSGQQDALLSEAEHGRLEGPTSFDSATWFSQVRDHLLLAFGSDPRGMVQMGYPGPSYTPGHIWLDLEEVKGRADRKAGYQTL